MYKRNFLDTVIARVDFAKQIAISQASLADPLNTKTLKYFPIPEPKTKIGKQLQVNPKSMKMTELTEYEWYYYGKDREKLLCIAPGCMFIKYNKYKEQFSKFKMQFLDILDSLCETYKDLEFRRLGLRYIDKIKLEGTDYFVWEEYLDKNLLSIFNVADDKTKISRAFHILEQNYGDMKLKFQYGMHNPDYPASIREKLFILDTDVFVDGLQTKEEIAGRLDNFHAKCEEFFERSITDKLREVMNE